MNLKYIKVNLNTIPYKKEIVSVAIVLILSLLFIFAVSIYSSKGEEDTTNVTDNNTKNNVLEDLESVSGGSFYDVKDVSAGVVYISLNVFAPGETFDNLAYAYKAGVDWLDETNPEDSVYTFLQGPRAYSSGITWGGDWCLYSIRGNSFGGFGCGLCCMANIYDTLSPYEVDPLEMFEYAKTASKYSPTSKTGAIGWVDMWRTLKKCGIDVRLKNKPATYEEFREDMKNSQSMVAVVSSYENNEYWTSTSGHYINIWLYKEDDETVFLAEPGNPENNRTRIPLIYVYNALKTASNYQYLMAVEYDEDSNEWKGDGISATWNSPD
ncbi:MAG: hypothetical protein K6E13_09070 [Lachnospiraceae bacterium]|nr:hypothetical protein [Lachnospiraceae bacterium]